jgi:hypothetical protein
VRPANSVVLMTGCSASNAGSTSRGTSRRHTCPRRARTASCGSASSRMRPRWMMAMREHRSLTSSTMCVERMTTAFSPSSLSRFRKRTRSAGSSPAVGSSTMMSRGLPMSATAIPKRCRIPPLKVPSRRPRASCRLVCSSSERTTSRRSPASTTPLSTAKWSSSSSAVALGYRPNSCGR